MAQDAAKTAQENSKSELSIDFGWILDEFGDDFGRLLVGFWMIFEEFWYGFMYLVRKRKQASMRLAPWTSWDWELLGSWAPLNGPRSPSGPRGPRRRLMEACWAKSLDI